MVLVKWYCDQAPLVNPRLRRDSCPVYPLQHGGLYRNYLQRRFWGRVRLGYTCCVCYHRSYSNSVFLPRIPATVSVELSLPLRVKVGPVIYDESVKIIVHLSLRSCI